MNKESIQKVLKEISEKSPKRGFKQTYDLIIVLKGLDMKKPDHQVDFFVTLHHDRGKKVKVCAFAGPELKENAKDAVDLVINVEDFDKYTKDKVAMKKLAREYDYFVAQANIMAKVATAFGKSLGPLGKMPNPKAGCVVPPNANLKVLVSRLGKTVRILAKKNPMVQVYIGKEGMEEEHIVDNIITIYNQVMHHLPNEAHNIRRAKLKLTMGPAIELK